MPFGAGSAPAPSVIRCCRSAPRLLGWVRSDRGSLTSTLVVVAWEELVVDGARLAEICARFGVARLDVFGSFATGAADADSDVDLLYELKPGRQLGWEIEDLSVELQSVLGRPVDLVGRSSVHPRLREAVLSEARTLYAA